LPVLVLSLVAAFVGAGLAVGLTLLVGYGLALGDLGIALLMVDPIIAGIVTFIIVFRKLGGFQRGSPRGD